MNGFLMLNFKVMKLKLEHLAGYLPYGLGIEILNYKCDYVGIQYSKVNGHYYLGSELYLTYEGGSTGKSSQSCKPILRPLSDLNRDDLFKMWSDHVDYLTTEREYWIKLKGINKYVDELPYSHYKYLLKNHFDIHGLIDQNLAIDINTL